MTFEDQLLQELAALDSGFRRRRTQAWAGADRAHPDSGSPLPTISFCSNDYLGLASHPAVLQAAAEAAATHGFGAGASRLVSGESPVHRALENDLADFVGLPAALLFPTGYQANIGAITAVAGASDLIVSDAANHASIIDGCRLSRATVVVYPHRDTDAAALALAQPGMFRRRLLITESLFSMDGDRAPLVDLARSVTRQGALLLVDEAHALGVTGPCGRGLCAETGVIPDLLVGTLGKAFGAAGGFVAGSAALRDILINRARTFIYTTATPPPVAAAARAALLLSLSPEGTHRRARACNHASVLRTSLQAAGLTVAGSDPILPVILGAERTTLAVAAELLRGGLLIPAIRPPTVADNTARLRITVSANHSREDIDRLSDALQLALASISLLPPPPTALPPPKGT